MFISDKIKDATGRVFKDDLTKFLNWYLKKNKPVIPFVPLDEAQHFVENVTSLVIYRQFPYQVQLFIAAPGTVIPEHVHPNVDSYEVFLRGMEFTHNGEVIVSMIEAVTSGREDMAKPHGGIIRVQPNDLHGGRASNTGGAFLSVQKWLRPDISSVGNDWDGESMGPIHDTKRRKA